MRMLICVVVMATAVSAYLPVVMLHGISYNNKAGTFHDWDNVKSWISEAHPGTPLFALDFFNGLESTRPMWEQLDALVTLVQKTIAANPAVFRNGWIGMGHSQGGLMMRCLTEAMDNHGMRLFISLAGVQHGVYGVPLLPPSLANLSASLATDVLYTMVMQAELSIANFWQDPLDYARFTSHNAFLPLLNNEVASPDSARYKRNFLSLDAVHCFASPQDGVVEPWVSELFAFYRDGSVDVLAPTNATRLYKGDLFGLRTLDQRGDLHLHIVPGIEHAQWINNATNFRTHVMKLLV